MIEAIIHYHDSTLIVDLPRSIYDIHEKLMTMRLAKTRTFSEKAILTVSSKHTSVVRM